MSFGEYIRNIRTDVLQITMDELAERTGISKGYFSRLENNKIGIPKIETLEKIAKGLEVDYVEILEKAGYIDEQMAIREVKDLAGNEMPEGLRLFVHEFIGHYEQSFKDSPLRVIYSFLKISKGDEFYYSCIRSHVVLGNINPIKNKAMVTIISESCGKNEFFNSINQANVSIDKDDSGEVPFIEVQSYIHAIHLGNRERGNLFFDDLKGKLINILKNNKKLPFKGVEFEGNFYYLRAGTTRFIPSKINK